MNESKEGAMKGRSGRKSLSVSIGQDQSRRPERFYSGSSRVRKDRGIREKKLGPSRPSAQNVRVKKKN